MDLIVKWLLVRLLGIRKLRKEGVIRRDDIVIGILTGKTEGSKFVISYHMDWEIDSQILL